MWRDWEDWGRGENFYVVKFTRDRFIGTADSAEVLTPFLDPANYRAETRYIYIRDEITADTDDIDSAATFDTHAEAAAAIKRHREYMGDVGRMYEIARLSE